MFNMCAEPSLTELESRIMFLAELAKQSGNPFFHHGIYRGEVEDDMLVSNGSIFLSISQSECRDTIKRLQEKSFLSVRSGEEKEQAIRITSTILQILQAKKKSWRKLDIEY